MRNGILGIVLSLFCALSPADVRAQIVGIALDAKPRMVDGNVEILPSPPPDSVVFFEFSGAQAKRLGRIAAPTSFQGPPSSVAVSADGAVALVTAFTRVDPGNPQGFIPDNRLTVIDLRSSPLRVVQTLALPAAPSSVALNPAGTLALVPHTSADSITLLSLRGLTVEVSETLRFEQGSGPIAAAFSSDGGHALISFPAAGKIGWFAVEDGRLRLPALREMSAGVWPTAISFCGLSGLAAVANYGKVTGDADTVSLIDVGARLPHVIDTATVGIAPEGVACSPDGQYVAASVQNMSTVPHAHPLYSPHSRAVLLKIEGKRLRRVTEADFGGWAQGIGFLDDSRTLFAQSMNDRSLHLFRIEGETLLPAAPPLVFAEGAPVSYGISGR